MGHELLGFFDFGKEKVKIDVPWAHPCAELRGNAGVNAAM